MPYARMAEPREAFVWDRFVRVFHWTTVALVATAFTVDDRWLHEAVGLAVLPLVATRIIWGFVGPAHARFSDFVVRPSGVLAYLRAARARHAPRYLGHNPAGGAMVVALLALLPIVALSGWMSQTDRWFGVPWVSDLHAVSANLLLLLAGLHIAGVIVSTLLHRENYIRAMFTGRKPARLPGEEAEDEQSAPAGPGLYPG